jgi:hypothetical protein
MPRPPPALALASGPTCLLSPLLPSPHLPPHQLSLMPPNPETFDFLYRLGQLDAGAWAEATGIKAAAAARQQGRQARPQAQAQQHGRQEQQQRAGQKARHRKGLPGDSAPAVPLPRLVAGAHPASSLLGAAAAALVAPVQG